MDLVQSLKKNLGNALVFSFQAQSFHWNVSGMLFHELHKFFGEIYETAYNMIDPLAEYIRIENILAPCCLADAYKDKSMNEITHVPGTAQEMIMYLYNMSIEMKTSLEELMALAEKEKRYGLADWVSGQIDILAKQQWMLRSYTV